MIKILKAKAKKLILKLSGKVSHLKKGIDCTKIWYGNVYGGFYGCPDFLNNNSVVYSFGIGEDISFDKAIIEKHDCEVFAFDPTPKSINWVSQQEISEKFRFFEFGISNKSGFVDFFLSKNPNHVSGSMISQNNINPKEKVIVEMKTMQDILNELNHKHIDVLKMDIEGEEYDVIDNILDNNISVDQILIEFHDRFFDNGTVKSLQTVKKLKSKGYEIFAVSDSFEEVSFIKKSIL
jgi:FkbM family methyltransferase